MQSHERQLLQSNIEPLARAINNFADISKLLLVRKTFTPAMINHIQGYSSDTFFRNVVLISDIQTRGPTAFKEFIEILELAGCIEALKVISPRSLIRQHNSDGDKKNPLHNEINVHSTNEQVKGYPLGLFSYGFSTNTDANNVPLSDDSKLMSNSMVKSSNEFERHNNEDGDHENLNYQQNSFSQQHRNIEKQPLHWHPYTVNITNELSGSVGSAQTSYSVRDNINITSVSNQIDDNDMDRNSIVNNFSNVTIGCSRAPKAMNVKRAIICQDDPLEDYKMTARPRGLCLIINNMDFDGDILPQRKGSDIDASRFESIFEQLWFEVHHKRNLTAANMKKIINTTAKMCKEDHDALIVITLSHGSSSGVYGTDGLEVDPYDIYSRFDNERCKSMKDKPKVFIFQACRGTLADYGEKYDEGDSQEKGLSCEEDLIQSIPDRPPLFTRSIEFFSDRGTYPVRTDMMICYSCLPGYVSVRNEIAGSWLGTALGYYLMTCACEKDFEQILAMVSKDFEGKVSSHGYKQALEIKYLGWRKKLYFNPGIYR